MLELPIQPQNAQPGPQVPPSRFHFCEQEVFGRRWAAHARVAHHTLCSALPPASTGGPSRRSLSSPLACSTSTGCFRAPGSHILQVLSSLSLRPCSAIESHFFSPRRLHQGLAWRPPGLNSGARKWNAFGWMKKKDDSLELLVNLPEGEQSIRPTESCPPPFGNAWQLRDRSRKAPPPMHRMPCLRQGQRQRKPRHIAGACAPRGWCPTLMPGHQNFFPQSCFLWGGALQEPLKT